MSILRCTHCLDRVSDPRVVWHQNGTRPDLHFDRLSITACANQQTAAVAVDDSDGQVQARLRGGARDGRGSGYWPRLCPDVRHGWLGRGGHRSQEGGGRSGCAGTKSAGGRAIGRTCSVTKEEDLLRQSMPTVRSFGKLIGSLDISSTLTGNLASIQYFRQQVR